MAIQNYRYTFYTLTYGAAMNIWILLALIVFTGVSSLSAQTTGRDWTKTDCDGVEHHLYSELDSGNVVVLELIMINCSPCVTAAKGLKSTLEQFEAAHPGKVRLYSIGYSDQYNCTHMANWRSKAGLSHAVFTGGGSDVEYYGGMGMPTIVVLGGTSHEVYYKKQGYQPADNSSIAQAVSNALAGTTGVPEYSESPLVQVYPQPAQSECTVAFRAGAVDAVVLSDMTGREVVRHNVEPGAAQAVLPVAGVYNGVYNLRLMSRGAVVETRMLVVQQ